MFRSLMLATALLAGTPSFASGAWHPVESAKWVAIPPADGDPACELTDSTGTRLHGIWRMIDSGDTLRYAVRGSGTLRVETRAIVANEQDSATYRIGVRTDPSTVRRLARKSGGPTEVSASCTDASLRVLEADRWETGLVAGSERVEVFLREGRTFPILVRVLARGEIERPGAPATERSTEVAWKFGAGTLGAGFTTNAYLAPTDSNSAETAFFLPVEISAMVRIEPREDFQLDFEYEFGGLYFRDTILNVYRHKFEAQQRWKDVGLGSLGEGQIEIEQQVLTKDRTYFGRGYDEELETAAGNPPADEAYLADRFDSREYRIGIDLEVEATDALEYGAAIGYVRKDYVEDYLDDPDTYALDWGGVAAEVRAGWRGERDFYALLSAEGRDRRYDEKFSRDETGTVARDDASHLSYWPVELEIGQSPRTGFRWEARARRLRVLDHYEGYWDRTNWRVLIEGTLALEKGHRLRVHVGRSVTDYDRARVGNTPSGPIREKDVWLIGGEVEYVLGRNWQAIAELEYLDRNNNSREFDYSLLAGRAGLNWEF